mgnify:FL=1
MSEIAREVPIELRDIKREPRVKPKNAPRKITHTVTLVPAGYVTSLWFEVRDYLGPAVARTRGRWSMESLHAALLGEHQHLWLAFDENNQIDGVGTTEFVDYPCKRMLAIQFLGGKNFNDWVWDMVDCFNNWAKDNHCDGVEAKARTGFWKWLEQDGYTRSFTVYEKGLNDG